MNSIGEKDFAVKIAIMYIIDRYGEATEENILTKIAIEICDINYFVLKQCELELCDLDYIHKFADKGKEYYILLEKGEVALELFKPRLPYTLRTKITEMMPQYRPEEYKRNSYECYVLPVSDTENNVVVSYKEGKNTLMEIQFFAGGSDQANELAKAMRENKSKIFSDIYDYISRIKDDGDGAGEIGNTTKNKKK